MDADDDKTLFKKTLLTVAAMVGACVVVVGSLSLLVLLVVGRATKAPDAEDHTPVLAPTGNGAAPRALPAAPTAPKAPVKSNQI